MLNRLIPIWDGLCRSAQRANCSTGEDLVSFHHRAGSEGLPYLSDGLAGLGRTFLASIRRGYCTKEDFQANRQALKEGSTLPVFLYSAWSKVFTDDGLGIGASFEKDSCGNLVLTDWKPPIIAQVAVMWLRQLTVVFSKLRLPHKDAQCEAAFERFRANEEDLALSKGRLWSTTYANDTTLPFRGKYEQSLTDVLLNARRLLCKVLCNVSPREISPRHGSGAASVKLSPTDRYDRILFDPDQAAIWPYVEFASAGRDHSDQILSSDFLALGYQKRARAVFVQKDYRGPRLISCEPPTSMYYQQGLMNLLVETAESHPLTRSFVNFTNQSINQKLARIGSTGERSLATLDLKDASDCLSWDLVLLLWPDDWRRALSAVRSKVTDISVPGKGIVSVPLRKHAPMGSATCFPVMALSIWCLIKAAQFSAKPSKAWIYGDDIIVASRDATVVCDLLESVGLKVNRDKSFYGATPFRESCGKEYWDGFDTTPIYCRYDPTDDDSIINSLVSFVNNMTQRHGVMANYEMIELIAKMTKVPVLGKSDDQCDAWCVDSDVYLLPLIRGSLSMTDQAWGANLRPFLIIGNISQCSVNALRRRWNMNLQRWEFRIRVPRPEEEPVRATTWGYILRDQLLRPVKDTSDGAPQVNVRDGVGKLMTAAVANRVCYKYGWVAIPGKG